MFKKKSDSGYLPAVEKIRMKTLVYGEKTLLSEFQLDKGALLPLHSHPHEQTGYLVSGKMELIIGQEQYLVEPGDSWSIPGGTEHAGRALEDSIAVEVFSPVREDYLPAAED